jgi:putative methyltransferase (TIGR04325 family)
LADHGAVANPSSARSLRTALLNRLTNNWSVRRVHRRIAGTGDNIHAGEYASVAEALAAIPPHTPVGFDNKELASWYRERLDQVQTEDYPVLFWLRRLLPDIESVFDFGGHIGLHFYSWLAALGLPASFRWQVCDVPAVVESGRVLARERGNPPQLSFTTDPADADGKSVFLGSGSVQFLDPDFLYRSLGSMKAPPPHLLLNKLPVHETRDFITVHDTNAAFHPYNVVSRARLSAELERIGYRQVDAWKNPSFHCRVVLRPDLEVPEYSGSYWTRNAK